MKNPRTINVLLLVTALLPVSVQAMHGEVESFDPVNERGGGNENPGGEKLPPTEVIEHGGSVEGENGNGGESPTDPTNTGNTESTPLPQEQVTQIQQALNEVIVSMDTLAKGTSSAVNNTITAQQLTPQQQATVTGIVTPIQTSLTATQAVFEAYAQDPTNQNQKSLSDSLVRLGRAIKKLQNLQTQGIDVSSSIAEANTLMTKLSKYKGKVVINEGGNTSLEPVNLAEPKTPVTPEEPTPVQPVGPIENNPIASLKPTGDTLVDSFVQDLQQFYTTLVKNKSYSVRGNFQLEAQNNFIDNVQEYANALVVGDQAEINRVIESVKEIAESLQNKTNNFTYNNLSEEITNNINKFLDKVTNYQTKVSQVPENNTLIATKTVEQLNNFGAAFKKLPLNGSDDNKALLLDATIGLSAFIVKIFPDSGARENLRFTNQQDLEEFFSTSGTKIIQYFQDQINVLQNYSPDQILEYNDKINKLMENINTITAKMGSFSEVQKANAQSLNTLTVGMQSLNAMVKTTKTLQSLTDLSGLYGSNKTPINRFLSNIKSAFAKMFGQKSSAQAVQDFTVNNKAVMNQVTTTLLSKTSTAAEVTFSLNVIEKQKALLDGLKTELKTTAFGQFAARHNLETAIDILETKLADTLNRIPSMPAETFVKLPVDILLKLPKNTGQQVVATLRTARSQVAPFGMLYRPEGQGKADIDLTSQQSIQNMLQQGGFTKDQLANMSYDQFVTAYKNVTTAKTNDSNQLTKDNKELREIGTVMSQSPELFAIIKRAVANNNTVSAVDLSTIQTKGQQYYTIANLIPKLDMAFSE